MKVAKAVLLYASMIFICGGAILGVANDATAAGTGICWDVRVQRHVPCGWNPPSSTSPSQPSTVPSGPSPQELERQRQEQLRLQREREEAARRKRELLEAEREAERRREEARRQFELDKSEALRMLKSGTEALAPKTGELKGALGGGLRLKSGTPTLGLKETPNPTEDKAFESFGGDFARGERLLSMVEKQLACATSIVSPSFSAARRGDAAEVRYLGGQAKRAMLGQTLEVECGMSVPAFQAGPVTLKKLGPVFEKLSVALEKQARRINQVDERIENATDRQKKEQAKIETFELKVKQLKKEIRAIPPPSPGVRAEEARAERDKKKKEKESVLKEALAALSKATEAWAATEKSIRGAQAEKKEAENELTRLESLFGKALKNPSLAPEIEKQTSK